MKTTEELCEILNKAYKLLPEKPTYGEFNRIFKIKENSNKLRDLESQYPIIGICRFGTPDEGLSVVSLIATITDFFDPGARLGLILEHGNVQEDRVISGFIVVRTTLTK